MTCAHCEALEEEIAFLRGELGLMVTETQMAAAMRAFVISPTPAKILLRLHGAKGRVVSRHALCDELTKGDDNRESTLFTHMCVLRRALGREAFETVHGRGYRLSAAGSAKVAATLGMIG